MILRAVDRIPVDTFHTVQTRCQVRVGGGHSRQHIWPCLLASCHCPRAAKAQLRASLAARAAPGIHTPN